MTPKRALHHDPSLPVQHTAAGTPRRAAGASRRVPLAKTIAAVGVSVAAAATGLALVLPYTSGGASYAIASPAASPSAEQLAAVGTQTPTAPATTASATAAPVSAASSSSSTGTTTTKATTSKAAASASSSTKTTTAKATTTTKAASSAATSSGAAQVVAYVKARIGYPYKVGTMGPDYYDCAGLVAAAYRSAGFDMPFSEAYESSHGTYVGIDDLKPGDVVAWGSPVHSVSIYIGNDTIIIADGPNYGVRTYSLSGRTSWDTFAGGHRYL